MINSTRLNEVHYLDRCFHYSVTKIYFSFCAVARPCYGGFLFYLFFYVFCLFLLFRYCVVLAELYVMYFILFWGDAWSVVI
jgi:hypothetical protein